MLVELRDIGITSSQTLSSVQDWTRMQPKFQFPKPQTTVNAGGTAIENAMTIDATAEVLHRFAETTNKMALAKAPRPNLNSSIGFWAFACGIDSASNMIPSWLRSIIGSFCLVYGPCHLQEGGREGIESMGSTGIYLTYYFLCGFGIAQSVSTYLGALSLVLGAPYI